MSNSVPPFSKATLRDLLEAIGITTYSTDGLAASQQVAGFLIQGGKTTLVSSGGFLDVPFVEPFQQQVISIQITGIHATDGVCGTVNPTFTLEGFRVHNTGAAKEFFWWAVGV